MRTRKILFGLAIAILATNSLVAQDDMSAEKALARATETTTAQMMKTFARAELTEEQQASAVTIIENHIASLVAAKDAQAATLTEEQIAKKRAAWDQGKADGLKGKKLYAAANDAMGLTEEQQAVYDAAKEKIKTVNTTIRTEIRALLTEEQVAAMPVKAGKKRAKKTAQSTPQTVSLKLPNMT